MPIPVLLGGLLSVLAEKGLGILAGAIEAKGKDVVEKVIGVKIPDDPKALTPELLQQLQIRQMEHEEKLLGLALEEKRIDADLEKTASQEATKRWQADMSSDSWLSKNIRPLGLIWTFLLITGMVIADAAGTTFRSSLTEMVEAIALVIVGAYYLGRSVEKGTSIFKKAKGA